MPDTASATAHEECAAKHALLEQISRVIDDLLSVHNAEVNAIIGGDLVSAESMQMRMRELRERKALLLERLYRHVREHGC